MVFRFERTVVCFMILVIGRKLERWWLRGKRKLWFVANKEIIKLSSE